MLSGLEDGLRFHKNSCQSATKRQDSRRCFTLDHYLVTALLVATIEIHASPLNMMIFGFQISFPEHSLLYIDEVFMRFCDVLRIQWFSCQYTMCTVASPKEHPEQVQIRHDHCCHVVEKKIVRSSLTHPHGLGPSTLCEPKCHQYFAHKREATDQPTNQAAGRPATNQSCSWIPFNIFQLDEY